MMGIGATSVPGPQFRSYGLTTTELRTWHAWVPFEEGMGSTRAVRIWIGEIPR
jgi:hypothetical protein